MKVSNNNVTLHLVVRLVLGLINLCTKNNKNFLKMYRKICTTEQYSFLVNVTTHLSHNPLPFRKNLKE